MQIAEFIFRRDHEANVLEPGEWLTDDWEIAKMPDVSTMINGFRELGLAAAQAGRALASFFSGFSTVNNGDDTYTHTWRPVVDTD